MMSGERGDCACLVRKDTACAVSSSSFSSVSEESLSESEVQDAEVGKWSETSREWAELVGRSSEDTSASRVFPHMTERGEFFLFISKLSIRESRLSTSEGLEKLRGCRDNSTGVILMLRVAEDTQLP